MLSPIRTVSLLALTILLAVGTAPAAATHQDVSSSGPDSVIHVLNLSLRGVESQDQLMLIPSQTISEVPEPASLVLFGSGVSVAAIVRRRRKRR